MNVGGAAGKSRRREKETMPRKQNQVVAVEKGLKDAAKRAITDVYHAIQKPDTMTGFVRQYTPSNEEGDRLPTERKLLQTTLADQTSTVRRALADWYDCVATKSWTNCEAKADVVVDGKVLLSAVPVDFLLFARKQLEDLRTMVEKMPTLDPGEEWAWDSNRGCYASATVEQVRTQKLQKPLVLYHATPEHPAQTQVISEDVPVGRWKTTKLCGALPVDEQRDILRRVDSLLVAVKQAREQANMTEAREQRVAAPLLDYVFGAAK